MSFSLRARAAACAVLLTRVALSAQDQSAKPMPERLTLPQAIEEALARSPILRARRAEVGQADGRLLTARTYPFNPEIAVEGNRRTHGDTTTDRGVALGQEIEVGGQRRQRAAHANAEQTASRARLLREERLLAARVGTAFVDALRVRDLREVERANVELVRSLAEVARKRFDSGAVAQMEVNLARVQLGRAERDLRLAEAAHEIAKALLAEVVGLDPAHPPEPDGELGLAPRELPPLKTLLDTALEHREDLQSLRSSSEAARARIELARREAVPNLRVEASYGREDGTDRLLGGSIRFGIPVFHRNQGRIAEARAAHHQSLAETEAAELEVRRGVTVSLERYLASQAASTGLQQQVLGTLEENLRLLQRSFEAGKIDWTEVLVFRREFVEIERDFIETLTDARLAGIELDLAAGIAPVVSREEPQP